MPRRIHGLNPDRARELLATGIRMFPTGSLAEYNSGDEARYKRAKRPAPGFGLVKKNRTSQEEVEAHRLHLFGAIPASVGLTVIDLDDPRSEGLFRAAVDEADATILSEYETPNGRHFLFADTGAVPNADWYVMDEATGELIEGGQIRGSNGYALIYDGEAWLEAISTRESAQEPATARLRALLEHPSIKAPKATESGTEAPMRHHNREEALFLMQATPTTIGFESLVRVVPAWRRCGVTVREIEEWLATHSREDGQRGRHQPGWVASFDISETRAKATGMTTIRQVAGVVPIHPGIELPERDEYDWGGKNEQFKPKWREWLASPTRTPEEPSRDPVLWPPATKRPQNLLNMVSQGKEHVVTDRQCIDYMAAYDEEHGIKFRATTQEVEGDEVTTREPQWFEWSEEDGWNKTTKERVCTYVADVLMYVLEKEIKGGGYAPNGERADRISFQRQIVGMMRGLAPWKTPAKAWDSDPYLLPHPKAKVTDLRTGVLRPMKADDLCRRTTNVLPIGLVDETHESYKVWKRLLPIEELREAFLQKMSLCLVGGQFIDRVMMFEGKGGTGKTSAFEALLMAMGRLGITLSDEFITVAGGDRYNASSTAAQLEGVRMGLVKDLKVASGNIDTGRINGIVGNTRTRERDVRGRSIEVRLGITPIIVGNRIAGPDQLEDSTGTMRRVEFYVSPAEPPEHEDPEIRKAIQSEEGQANILQMMIDRVVRLLQKRTPPPLHPWVEKWNLEWQTRSDELEEILLQYLKRDPGGRVSTEELAHKMNKDADVEMKEGDLKRLLTQARPKRTVKKARVQGYKNAVSALMGYTWKEEN